MRIIDRRRITMGLAICGLVIAAAVSVILPTPPAYAVGSYANAAIADRALTFLGQNLGAVNGQCRKFVNDVVWSVSGGTQNLSTGNGDYFQPFLNASGQEITNYNSLLKGDIVQKYVSGTNLHTWIIVSRDSDGRYWVVDANSQSDYTVRHYKRDTFTLNSTTRAFRMGTISTAQQRDIAWLQGSTLYTFSGSGFNTVGSVTGIGTPNWGSVMDYDGDGKDDLVFYYAATATIDVFKSSNQTFYFYTHARGPGVGAPNWAGIGNFHN